jgi:hypothetical protein
MAIFLWQSIGTQKIQKSLVPLAARAIFVSPFFTIFE